MKYKLIAVDIDGTLLDDEKRVPALVQETLGRAAKSGIKIALVSGRMPFAVELVERELSLPCIKACSAGTCILLDSGETVTELILPETAWEVYHRVAEKFRLPLWVYRERSWMVTGVDDHVRRESRIIHLEPEIISMEQRCRQWSQEHTGPNKLLFAARPDIIEALPKELEMFRPAGLDFARSDDTYLEVFPQGANKGKALKTICERLGIRREESMAFGDQELDLPMLEAAGFGVAMGNAIPAVKSRADYVTKSNNEAGVAVALQELLGL